MNAPTGTTTATPTRTSVPVPPLTWTPTWTPTSTPTAPLTSTPTSTMAPVVPRQRRLRPQDALPLGSLTQREHRSPDGCVACGSLRLTRLSMNLTDGGSVDFVSCHHCEHRGWQEAGADVPVAEVLLRTARR